MKVVLRSDVPRLGKRGDVVEVKDGYARNHLVPGGMAMVATPKISEQAASMRRSRDRKDARDREGAQGIAQRLVPAVITIPARAGREGRLFGSVTPSDVVDAVEAQTGIRLDRRRFLDTEPIKDVGTHEVPVRLHADVEFRLTVEVVPS